MVVSDNGPQYDCMEIIEFTRQCDFCHISTTLIEMDRQRGQFGQQNNFLHLTHVSSTELLGYTNASADDAKIFSFCQT